ncbi:unnamed protein product [Caenorhabditis auriculariae]|uniref:Uncharacterized protein n=1 Tax=Caenorhabditis auriculariae TaxID=2777116 RepID=A0A8S1HFJ9_9PELO|nr:unnamed protein product [Caenorhabditis auriculariae]
MADRYIRNPFEHNYKEQPLSTGDEISRWLDFNLAKIRDGLGSVKDFANENDYDVYTGIGGVYWALKRCEKMCPGLYDESNYQLIQDVCSVCEPFITGAEKVDRQYLTGNLATIAVIGSESGLITPDDSFKILRQTGETLLKLNSGKGDDELFVGRAGWLAAVLHQTDDVQKKLEQMVRDIILVMINEGQRISKEVKAANVESVPPLMYSYHGTFYIGAAHGLAGILTILLSFHKMMNSEAKKLVVDTARWVFGLQDAEGNFPSSVWGREHKTNNLVHWCHGATGVSLLAMKLYLVDENEEDLQVARRALQCLWTRGVLRKGNGLCHGVSGNGYPFLLMYRLSGCEQTEYLQKANCFAQMTCDEAVEAAQRVPDSPFSLFEGLSGAVAFLVDIHHPKYAEFPFFPIFREFNY